MSIGLLAMGFGVVCAVVTLTAPRPDRKTTTPDYTRIYEAITPREIF